MENVENNLSETPEQKAEAKPETKVLDGAEVLVDKAYNLKKAKVLNTPISSRFVNVGDEGTIIGDRINVNGITFDLNKNWLLEVEPLK